MTYTAKTIIEGLRLKDAKAFEYLYQKYGAMIAGHVQKNSGSEEDAKEIIQIAILELWIAVKENRYQEQGKLDQYVYQLAANSWKEELRRRRNRPQAALTDSHFQLHDQSEASLAEAVVKDKFLQAIHQGIGQLGEPCKTIIELYHLQKIQLQEVAKQMQYDYDNLRKRIFDCRKKLKKMVSALVSEEEAIFGTI